MVRLLLGLALASGVCALLPVQARAAEGDTVAPAEAPAESPAVAPETTLPGPRPLPPPSAFTVVLSNEVTDDDATPVNPGTDLLSMAKHLYVTVSAAANFDFSFTVRVLAENVPGMPRGKVVLTPDMVDGGAVGADRNRGQLRINCPDDGLPPGVYHLELIEYEEPRRVFARAEFSAHLPALPSPDTLAVALHEGSADRGYDESSPAITETSSFPAYLCVTVTANPAVGFAFTTRIVTDDVTGFPRGTVIGAVNNSNSNPATTLSADDSHGTSNLALPRIGLPPGSYHVEVLEGVPPYRFVKAVPFTSRATELNEPEFNLADSEFGGLMESVTDEDGAGATCAPQLLARGNSRMWTPLGRPAMEVNEAGPPNGGLPCDLVISFFEHEPAQVSAVELLAHDAGDNMPVSVEIWGSPQSATDGFVKLATAALDPNPPVVSRIEFPAATVRYVRVRLLSMGDSTHPLALVGIRVLEGKAAGYQPLAQRRPDLAAWRLQPRHAAQQGLYFLQPTAVQWQQSSACLGCHMQSQSLMGISVAQKNQYVTSGAVQGFLRDYVLSLQNPAGDIARSLGNKSTNESDAESSNTIFAALGLAYSPLPTPAAGEALVRAAAWLAKQSGDEGSVLGNDGRAPIEQGEIMFTANCLDVWAAAQKIKPDPAVGSAFTRGVAFIAQAGTTTTQDKAFKIMVLARHGDAAQKKLARTLAARLQLEQQTDGGWKVEPDDPLGTAAFSTGQVLYAFRLANINPNSRSFQRGVQFLLARQNGDGSWKDPQLSSPFSATMWPVIALAGSFGSKLEPAHITITALPRPPAPAPAPPAAAPATPPAAPPATAAPPLPDNIEFVLDCSLSMLDRLGDSDRISTAKKVMQEIIARLPDNARVGLRLYGHRYPAMSSQSSRDTQLLVPIQPLQRDALLAVIKAAAPQGQTPLVYSTLLAGDDLKKVGGGTIIVVTDGEESCGGKPRKAGLQLAALGVPVRLDIIGFTLTGKRVVEDLTAFTSATGGRYYTAADGAALSRALAEAIAPPPAVTAAEPPPPPPAPPPPPEPVIEDFPYEILNAAGEKVAASTTLSGENPDLEPGVYRVLLRDGAKATVAASVKVDASETVELRYSPGDGTLSEQK